MKEPREEADRWRRQAQSDFEFLDTARSAGRYDICCFLAQQTAEKALKAFLFSQGEELLLTHSVFKLCEMATQYEPAFASLKDQVKLLDFYYVEARYPNAIPDAIPAEFYNDNDAAQAITMAEATLSLVDKFLHP